MKTRAIKKKPKIIGYRKCLHVDSHREWTWECPVWFSNGIIADVGIKGISRFDTRELAYDDMTEKLKLFGITTNTKVV